MTNHRSHRQLIHAIGPALRTLKALDLPATIVRIGDAVDDGMGAVATDSDHVTGSGSGSSTTERLALRALPDEHGRKRADRALADLVALKRLLASTLANLHDIATIARRWPAEMPRKERSIDAPGNDCGVCGRHTTGSASDRLRSIHAPTADGAPRPVPGCEACYKSWGRMNTKCDGNQPPELWREWAECRRNAEMYPERVAAQGGMK